MKLRYWTTLFGVILAIGGCAIACQGGDEVEPVIGPFPEQAEDVELEELIGPKYIRSAGGGSLCGSDVFSTYAGVAVPHGLSATSVLPAELVQVVEEFGWTIDQYQHRWFGEYRVVLLLTTVDESTQAVFAHALELKRLAPEDGDEFWSVPERQLARSC